MPTSSRRARIALYIVLGFVILAGVTSAAAQWYAGQRDAGQRDAEAKTAQEESDEIARCLTGFRLRYVDAPAERARNAEKRVLELVAKGEIKGDEFVTAVDDFAAIGSDVDAFEDLNRLARKNPKGFLRVCREQNP